MPRLPEPPKPSEYLPGFYILLLPGTSVRMPDFFLILLMLQTSQTNKQPPGMKQKTSKNHVNNAISYQPQLVFSPDFFHLRPSTGMKTAINAPRQGNICFNRHVEATCNTQDSLLQKRVILPLEKILDYKYVIYTFILYIWYSKKITYSLKVCIDLEWSWKFNQRLVGLVGPRVEWARVASGLVLGVVNSQL